MERGADDRPVSSNVLLCATLVIEAKSAIPDLQVAPAGGLNAQAPQDLPAELGAGAEAADIAISVQEERARNIVTTAQTNDRVDPCVGRLVIHSHLSQVRVKANLSVEVIDPPAEKEIERGWDRVDHSISERKRSNR